MARREGVVVVRVPLMALTMLTRFGRLAESSKLVRAALKYLGLTKCRVLNGA